MAFNTTSCEDPGDVQFEDDNFSSTLYLKDTGLIDIDFYNINKDVTFTTAVGKGGTDRRLPGWRWHECSLRKRWMLIIRWSGVIM